MFKPVTLAVDTAAIVIIIVLALFFIGFAITMLKIVSEGKKKEFEKKTNVKRGMERNTIENRKLEILNSINPNDPEDAKKKLELVKELDNLNKKNM